MADLHETRQKFKLVLIGLGVVDLLAVVLWFSPLVGSTAERQAQLASLRAELQKKTREVAPLGGLDQKITSARDQVAVFYRDRFPNRESVISAEFGKLAAAHGVHLGQAKYETKDVPGGNLQVVHIDANLGGDYLHLVQFIHALEKDKVFFIVNSVSLGEAQGGEVKLQLKADGFLKAGV